MAGRGAQVPWEEGEGTAGLFLYVLSRRRWRQEMGRERRLPGAETSPVSPRCVPMALECLLHPPEASSPVDRRLDEHTHVHLFLLLPTGWWHQLSTRVSSPRRDPTLEPTAFRPRLTAAWRP